MLLKIGRPHEAGNDQSSLAEKMGNLEIDNLRPHSKTENIDVFLKKISKAEYKESFENFKSDYIGDLEKNTANSHDEMREGGNYDDYSQEELKEIWENDPQYVNEKVYRPLPGTSQESIERQKLDPEDVMDKNSLYIKDGLHGDYDKKGLINWKHDSIPGTEVDLKIPEGTLLKRYGPDGGHYLTDIDTKFEDLNLPSDRFKVDNYMVIKPLPTVKSTIADQPFTMRYKDSPRASQYKTEMSVAQLVEKGYLKKMDEGASVKIGHFNEGEKQKDVHETSKENGEKHVDKKISIGEAFKNRFQKNEGEEQKPGVFDKLKSLFHKEDVAARKEAEQSQKSENPEKSTREKFLDSIKVNKNGEYVEKKENKTDNNNDANPEENNQTNETRNDSDKTNDFRENLKVNVDPRAHLNVKETPQREPGGRVPGPANSHYFDDEAER